VCTVDGNAGFTLKKYARDAREAAAVAEDVLAGATTAAASRTRSP
jgi:hypothetical protein